MCLHHSIISSGFKRKVSGTSSPIMSMVWRMLERPYFFCCRNLIECRENLMLFSKTCKTVLWLFSIFSYLLFNIVPTFVDIGVAIVYFIVAFNGWFGLLVFITMFLYVGKTDYCCSNFTKNKWAQKSIFHSRVNHWTPFSHIKLM